MAAREQCATAEERTPDMVDIERQEQDVIRRAREKYEDRSGHDVEIDAAPKLMWAENGCWVQAWVWVRTNG